MQSQGISWRLGFVSPFFLRQRCLGFQSQGRGCWSLLPPRMWHSPHSNLTVTTQQSMEGKMAGKINCQLMHRSSIFFTLHVQSIPVNQYLFLLANSLPVFSTAVHITIYQNTVLKREITFYKRKILLFIATDLSFSSCETD